MKIGDADQIRAADARVHQVAWPNDRGIDLPGDQSGHG